jgi:hypothetical protein
MIGSEIRPIADHRRRHHAGGRREQRADEYRRQREAAAQRTEHLPDGFEQILGHAAALENDPHEGEKGNGQQGVVLHDAEHPERQAWNSGRETTQLPCR